MTRTQKLGLCTWLPEDPVCLAEINDNFSRLDTSGARALRQAEAGLIALGGVMAAQAHQGGHAAYSDSIQADAFSDMEQVADYTGVYFLNQCGELLTEGVSDGTVFGNAADNAFNASGISRATQVTQTWVKLFSFYPTPTVHSLRSSCNRSPRPARRPRPSSSRSGIRRRASRCWKQSSPP